MVEKRVASLTVLALAALLFLAVFLCLAPAAHGATLEEARAVVAGLSAEQKAQELAALSELTRRKGVLPAGASRLSVMSFLTRELPSPCTGVGYLVPEFIGKPDPWPGNVPLENDELLAAFFARYNELPGGARAHGGYCCELFGVNQDSLDHAAPAGAYAPGSPTPLHAGCSTTTEFTDLMMVMRRGDPFACTWYWSFLNPTSAANPLHVDCTNDPLHCAPSQPFGPFTKLSPFRCLEYLFNDHHPDDNPPPPPPPPAPSCVKLAKVPADVAATIDALPSWVPAGGKRVKVKRLKAVLGGAPLFAPAEPSTGELEIKVYCEKP